MCVNNFCIRIVSAKIANANTVVLYICKYCGIYFVLKCQPKETK